jgi:hypothetical protein
VGHRSGTGMRELAGCNSCGDAHPNGPVSQWKLKASGRE